MELPMIGRVEKPEDLNLDPIVIPVVGYTMEREEVVEKFKFRPVQPAGAAMDILRQTLPNGNVPVGPVMRYLDKCLLEDDIERWREFLDRSDLMIEQNALIQIYKALTEVYAARPTLPLSDSAGGGSSAATTSRAAQRKQALAQK